ncbi:AAA family ATPase [Bacillus sp. ISL-7]|uniref:AAA family ATPase n=1 Tax=Bacillus sp. ISL-7 TaxID=2819136 RepID=UPI001BED399A|nr:AAA family ATPase [Bacillus sp. ISL-7]MBT2735176.1 AAA family ATPase [Bacillus sp. ISL-7]
MIISFKTLSLQNYKSHQDLKVNFGEVTKITGDNAKGKSSIPESISWLLYNTDTFGSKLDPTPLTYAAEETLVQLLLTHDGKELLLGRGLKKGKASYYINEVPSKATEFTEIVEQLFDKDLFMSQYNPSYFFTLKWDKQREILLKYVSAPANKEVLKKLPDLQAEKLGTLLKKHNLIDIDKIHRDNKNKKDKEYIAAQSRTKTLQEQLDQLPGLNVPIESIKVELSQIDKQVRDIETQLDNAWEKNQAYNNLQSKIRNLQDQVEMSKERWPTLKNEVIEDTCRTCKRPLDESSVESVKADKDKRVEQYKANHNGLVKQRDELKLQLAELEFIDVTDLREQLKIDEKGNPLRMALQSYSQFDRLQEMVNEAKENENEILKSLNDSIFVLDSIKAFNAKSAELQAEKVQALFTTLSIRLFKQNKGDGEIKPDFEIEMNEKPYRTLSLSEGIRAGLELRDVLSQQSELIAPCFVDNAESITSFKQPNGQLITSRVVAGQELKIEVGA